MLISSDMMALELDTWIRGSFVEMNCELDDLYWNQEDRNIVEGIGNPIKKQLLEEGRELITPLLTSWDSHTKSEDAYYLLGNVGYYMAACRRHEITLETRETESPLIEASALATKLGLVLGVAPRLVTSQMQYLNLAKDGDDRSFTRRADEVFFIRSNSIGQLNYILAAESLSKVARLGLSNPLAIKMLAHVENALSHICAANSRLFKQLDPDRFYYQIRPYVKSYRVGRQVWRGANAGDLSAIGEIDLRLGLCSASDPFYLGVLMEKAPYMIAGDQQRVASALMAVPFLDQLMIGADNKEAWVKGAAKAMVPIYDCIATIATQHHEMLVRRFIKQPTMKILEKHMQTLTASGIELQTLLADLQRLRDLRCGNDIDGVDSRHPDLERMRELAV